MPADIDACVQRMKGKADNPHALCNWMKANHKGFFGAEPSDAATDAAVAEYGALPADLESLTAEVLRLKAEGVGSVPELELFGAGLHREDDKVYTRQDIAAIVRNFTELSAGDAPRLPVTVGLDHLDGGPAVGLVSKVWVKPGGVLAVRVDDLPRLWSEAIEKGLWFRVSAEVADEPPFGLPGSGPCLVGMTLLGKQRPQLKWTSDLRELVKYGERSPPARWRACRVERTAAGRRVFSEGAAMAESATTTDALIELLAAQPVQLTPEILRDMNPDTLAAIAKQLTPEAPAGDGTADAAATTAELPPDFDRVSAIEAIVAADPAQDRAALEAMDDQALYDLWLQVTGGATAGAGMMSEGKDVPKPQTPAALQKFAESAVTAIRRERQAFAREVQARQRAERAARESAELETARRFAEELVRQGKVTPAERDGDPARGIPPLAEQIVAMPNGAAVHKFSEGGKSVALTARGAFLRALAAREPRRYGERLAVGEVSNERKQFFEKIIADTDARVAERKKRSGTLSERLGLNPPAHRR